MFSIWRPKIVEFWLSSIQSLTNLIKVEVIALWFLKDLFPIIQIRRQVRKKWVNLLKWMQSTVKLQKLSMVFLPIFIVCLILYNVSSIFNLNVHSFYKDQFFILKFIFIEVIESIYLIFLQNIQPLSRMYF